MTKIKDKLLWDYLDGKLDPKVRGQVSRMVETDEAVEERLERIRVLNKLIKDDLYEHIAPAPDDIAEGVMNRWKRHVHIREAASDAHNRIIYVFLGITAVLIAFGSTAFKGILKYAYVDYPGIRSIDPVYIYAVLVSVTVVILFVMVFDLAADRNI